MTVAGVDLGKTGLRGRLEPGAGPVEGDGAPGLAEPDGVERAWRGIVDGLRRAGAGDLHLGALAVGAAGAAADPASAVDLARRLAASFPRTRVAVTNDAVTSHVGALGGAAGAVLAAGTGAVAVGVGPGADPDGGPAVVVVVDGWGQWLGDDGSGTWIGREALRHVLRAADGRGPATSLTVLAEDRYGPLAHLPRVLPLGARSTRSGRPPSTFGPGIEGRRPDLEEGGASTAAATAAFVPDVVAAAERGDRVAADVLAAAGAALAATTTAAARAAGTTTVAAVGGLLAVGPLLVDTWRSGLPDDLEVVPARGTSLDGAVLLAGRDDLPHESAVHRVDPPDRGA